MESIREQITQELARSKVRIDKLYSILTQIVDYIEPPKEETPAPAPEPTPAPAAAARVPGPA